MIRSVTLPPTKSDRFFSKQRCCAVSASLQVECLALEKHSDKGLFSGLFSSYSNDAITLASHAQGLYQSPKYGKFMEPLEKFFCTIA
jgi:hypothetical protein